MALQRLQSVTHGLRVMSGEALKGFGFGDSMLSAAMRYGGILQHIGFP